MPHLHQPSHRQPASPNSCVCLHASSIPFGLKPLFPLLRYQVSAMTLCKALPVAQTKPCSARVQMTSQPASRDAQLLSTPAHLPLATSPGFYPESQSPRGTYSVSSLLWASPKFTSRPASTRNQQAHAPCELSIHVLLSSKYKKGKTKS